MGSKSTMTPSSLPIASVVERDPLGPARLDPLEKGLKVNVTTIHAGPDIIMPGLRPSVIILMFVELSNLQIHNNSFCDRRRRRLWLWLSWLSQTADVVLFWPLLWLLLLVVVTSLTGCEARPRVLPAGHRVGTTLAVGRARLPTCRRAAGRR